jgi:receptor expression-enhancing protein 1/2/3/4
MFFDGSTSSEEENTERHQRSMSGLSTRKSEVDFEKIDAESGTEEVESGTQKTAKRNQGGSGSWLLWSWGAQPGTSEASLDTVMAGTVEADVKGKSSGVDA